MVPENSPDTPQMVTCPNPDCPLCGEHQANIVSAGHSSTGPRFRCTECGKTFGTARGPLLRWLGTRTAPELLGVVTDYCTGLSIRRTAKAHGIAPATVCRFLDRAGDNGDEIAELLQEEAGLPPDVVARYRWMLEVRRKAVRPLARRRRRRG